MRINNFYFNRLYRNNPEAKGTTIPQDSKDSLDSKLVKKIKRKIAGKTLSEFDQEFWDFIFELINTGSQYSQQEKNAIVIDSTEYYILKTGGLQPPNAMLTAFADFLLDDTLADPDCYKSKREDYSILSHNQLKKRRGKESGVDVDTLDYLANQQKNSNNKRITSERSENQ